MSDIWPADKQEFINKVVLLYGSEDVILSTKMIESICNRYTIPFPFWLINGKEYKIDRGQWRIKNQPSEGDIDMQNDDDTEYNAVDNNGPTAFPDDLNVSPLVPGHHQGYVKFGAHKDLSTIIGSKQFYSVFLAGESGFGKTLMVYECCHENRRELIRVQISPETDKTSLMYVPNLKDGTLTHELGPVPEAMERGAVLLLDEIDRGTDKLICLNGILEGKPWYNEKTQKLIHANPGFTIVATGNSKGQGADDAGYLVRILDKALLERFPITFEHDFPNERTERNILQIVLEDLECPDEDFAQKLAQWSSFIRKTKEDGSEEIEIISTRRLVDICKAYKIWNDRKKAVTLCLNRFPSDIRKALIQHYEMIDIKAKAKSNATLTVGELFTKTSGTK